MKVTRRKLQTQLAEIERKRAEAIAALYEDGKPVFVDHEDRVGRIEARFRQQTRELQSQALESARALEQAASDGDIVDTYGQGAESTLNIASLAEMLLADLQTEGNVPGSV